MSDDLHKGLKNAVEKGIMSNFEASTLGCTINLTNAINRLTDFLVSFADESRKAGYLTPAKNTYTDEEDIYPPIGEDSFPEYWENHPSNTDTYTPSPNLDFKFPPEDRL